MPSSDTLGFFRGIGIYLVSQIDGRTPCVISLPKDEGVDIITMVRRNMKAKALSLWDRAMLSRRFIIETINDQLDNIYQIEHSRHLSHNSFMLNMLAGLVAYCLKENKPTLNITDVG